MTTEWTCNTPQWGMGSSQGRADACRTPPFRGSGPCGELSPSIARSAPLHAEVNPFRWYSRLRLLYSAKVARAAPGLQGWYVSAAKHLPMGADGEIR